MFDLLEKDHRYRSEFCTKYIVTNMLLSSTLRKRDAFPLH